MRIPWPLGVMYRVGGCGSVRRWIHPDAGLRQRLFEELRDLMPMRHGVAKAATDEALAVPFFGQQVTQNSGAPVAQRAHGSQPQADGRGSRGIRFAASSSGECRG